MSRRCVSYGTRCVRSLRLLKRSWGVTKASAFVLVAVAVRAHLWWCLPFVGLVRPTHHTILQPPLSVACDAGALPLHANTKGHQWLDSNVLTVRTRDDGLANRVEKFVLNLETLDTGRTVSNRGGGWQSKDLVAYHDPSLAELTDLFQEPLATFLQGSGLTTLSGSVSAVVDQIWANVNRPGHWNARHHHGSATRSLVASCVYFPAAPEGDQPAPLKLFPKEGRELQVQPEKGLLVLFPLDLEHEVAKSLIGNGDRVSVACNLGVRFLDTPLLQAAHAGSVDKVCDLITDGADVREQDATLGFQAIHLAAEAGHLSVVEVLVDRNANAAAVSLEGWSPLGLAASHGRADVVRYLQERGVSDDITPVACESDVPQIGITGAIKALQVAAEKGHLSVVELLAGIGGSALPQACAHGHHAVASYLLEHGEDPNAGSQKPLEMAASRGHASIVTLLLEAGADADARDETGQSAAHLAVQSGHSDAVKALTENGAAERWSMDSGDFQGCTVMHLAAQLGHTAIIEQLVKSGASMAVRVKFAVPSQPLHWATREGHVAAVAKLLELGAEVAAMDSNTPLVDQPRILIRKGADIGDRSRLAGILGRSKIRAEAAGDAKVSPLHVAASTGHLEVAAVLEQWGAPVDLKDDCGGTALHWAVANGHMELTSHLLQHGADVEATDDAGSQPLHDATWSGNSEVASLLIESGAGLASRSAGGLTPLHAAAIVGHAHITQLLLKHGADPNAHDAEGRTPLMFSLSSQQLLKSIGARGYGQKLAARAQEVVDTLQAAMGTSDS